MLAWNRDTDGGGVEGLAFFLNPPYLEPTGTNVQIVTTPADLLDSYPSYIDTLDFEGQVAIKTTGDKVYSVPSGITNIFLGPKAWLQGKLQFPASTSTTKIYGPGVLDGSLFDYERRFCSRLAQCAWLLFKPGPTRTATSITSSSMASLSPTTITPRPTPSSTAP